MYSDIYCSHGSQYRYNYETGNLECLKRRVIQEYKNNRFSSIVRLEVVSTLGISLEAFKKSPGYWLELYSVQGISNTDNNDFTEGQW